MDSHGHAIPLEFQGAPVPKKMNKLGAAGRPVPGTLLAPDPAAETAALDRARSDGHGNGEVTSPEVPAASQSAEH